MRDFRAVAKARTIETPRVERMQAMSAALAALLLGSFLILGVGFAHSSAIHNAAHDGRHAFAFPCH